MGWGVRLMLPIVATALVRIPSQAQSFDQTTPYAAPGTTPTRSLLQRSLDVVNAADDGMMCDGVTDDTAALQHALARSQSSSVYGPNRVAYGMKVQLPMGRCLLSSNIALTLNSNQALRLAGHGPYATELLFNIPSAASVQDGITITYSATTSFASFARSDSPVGNTGAIFQLSALSVVQARSVFAGTGLVINGHGYNINGTTEPDTIVDNVVYRGTSSGGGLGQGRTAAGPGQLRTPARRRRLRQ